MKSINGTIELTTHRHILTRLSHYDAISYVWESAPASITVLCNNKPLLITPTAFEMLQYLYQYQANKFNRKIWIDAICINQEDPEEKSTQIPLMRDIYSRAATVIVWMGPSTPETDVFFAEFQDVVEKSEDWIDSWAVDLLIGQPTREELPCREDAFWDGLLQLLNSEWFRRLWTFQEIILSRNATLLCGSSWVDFDEFVVFIKNGFFESNYIPTALRLGNSVNARIAFRACHRIYSRRKTGVFEPLLPAQVAETLNGLRYRNVKEPVDRVWAIAGLLGNHLRDKLALRVDYSAQGREEYWKTWIMFAKVLIEEPQGLKLLHIPPALEPRPRYLPSWCPNFSGKPACRMTIDGVWNRSISKRSRAVGWALFEKDSMKERKRKIKTIGEHSRKAITAVEHDKLLRIRGFVVDIVKEIVERENPLDMAYHSYDPYSAEHMALYDTAVDHHLKSLDLARRVFYGKSEGVTDIPDDFIMTFFLYCRITEAAKNVYCDVLPKFATYFSNPGVVFDWKQQQCLNQLKYIRGHTFFSTKGGRIGIAYPGCQPGDHVAVFYGGEPLYIVRNLDTTSDGNNTTGEASDHVQYLEAAFIPHLMEQDQRDAAHIGPDTMFFIH